MTVGQLRKLLETVANHKAKLSAAEAIALRKLAAALEPADKLTVTKAVEKLKV